MSIEDGHLESRVLRDCVTSLWRVESVVMVMWLRGSSAESQKQHIT
jgi:hypothetical protein